MKTLNWLLVRREKKSPQEDGEAALTDKFIRTDLKEDEQDKIKTARKSSRRRDLGKETKFVTTTS